jgi:hypothetical protein
LEILKISNRRGARGSGLRAFYAHFGEIQLFLARVRFRLGAGQCEVHPAEVNVNMGGVIRMTSAFIDLLTANKGTVINVSSGLAFVPLPSAPIYCATKAAVHSYTQSLRFQLEGTVSSSVDFSYLGQDGRPLPLGSPVLAKFPQYVFTCFAIRASSSDVTH